MTNRETLDERIEKTLARLYKTPEKSILATELYRGEKKGNSELDKALYTQRLIDHTAPNRIKLSYAGIRMYEKGGWLKEKDFYTSKRINYSLAIDDFRCFHNDLKNASKVFEGRLVTNDLEKYYDRVEGLLSEHLYGTMRYNWYAEYLFSLRQKYYVSPDGHSTADLLGFADMTSGIIETIRAHESGGLMEEKERITADENKALLQVIMSLRKENEILVKERTSTETDSVKNNVYFDHSQRWFAIYKILAFTFGAITFCLIIQYFHLNDYYRNAAYLIVIILAVFLYLKEKMSTWLANLIGILGAIFIALILFSEPLVKRSNETMPIVDSLRKEHQDTMKRR
ncbi:MAG TPA: DUF2304 domain-containing protein [Chryseolinea sp.]